jgi:hypothetical protein
VVGIQGNGIFLGEMHFPDRKNASLVVARGNEALVLGSFRNEEMVGEFEKALKELLGGGE